MTDLSQLPPLREVIARHRLSAKKSLGQNFILDANITDKIARAASPLEGHDVLEIGPGPGGLTRSLIAAGARRVVAVEKDERFMPPLSDLSACAQNLEIVHADAFEIDFRSLLGRPAKVVANLPFNAATALLAGWLESPQWPPFWASLTLMFQRETAERIVARPGSKDYGRLSVLAQWRSRARMLHRIPASAFVPRPKVDAAVVMIDRAWAPADGPDLAALNLITKAAFGQRRKMLRTSLKGLGPNISQALAAAGIHDTARPEAVSVSQFRTLAMHTDSLG